MEPRTSVLNNGGTSRWLALVISTLPGSAAAFCPMDSALRRVPNLRKAIWTALSPACAVQPKRPWILVPRGANWSLERDRWYTGSSNWFEFPRRGPAEGATPREASG